MFIWRVDRFSFSILILLLLLLGSCTSQRKVLYFDDLSSTEEVTALKTQPYTSQEIRINDLLSVAIQTIDPRNTASTNLISLNSGTYNPSTNSLEYLVNQDGTVELPMIGKVMLAGLTTEQARQLIQEESKKFFKDPIVTVRYVNFRITVLGEVRRPSTYSVGNGKISVLEAIGMAGDLTIYGRRDNVLLVRENSLGDKEFVRLNLNSSSIFSSPYYYLEQNDIIYIEPTKGKIVSDDLFGSRAIAVGTSLFTAIFVVLLNRFL